MIVDDSSYNLYVLQEILNQIDSKMQIETAMNGQLAIDKIRPNRLGLEAKTYDFIFMDL